MRDVFVIYQKEVGNMAGEKALTAELQKKVLVEKLWLAYFNQYLYEQKIITESERNRISLKIESRKAPTSGSKKMGNFAQ